MEENLERISVSTEEEFLQFLSNIDDYDYISKTLANAKGITVSFKIEGENFHSSITGSMITALAEYQKRIYHIYKVQRYGIKSTKSLSDDELRSLEIKVDIKPGCTEAVITFVKDIIPEVMKKMSGQEIVTVTIVVAGIVAGAWAIKGIASQFIKERFKTKRSEIDSKIEIAKTEKEKEFLLSMRSVTHDAIEGMRSVATGLRIANPESISVDGQVVPSQLRNMST